MADSEEIKVTIRSWVALDDEARKLQARQKAIRDEKARLVRRVRWHARAIARATEKRL